MSETNRDPNTGQFTGEPEPEGAGAEDFSWAEQFVKAAGVSPDTDPYTFAQAAQQWNALSDQRYGPAVYQQLKAQFEPEPEPEPNAPWNFQEQPPMEPSNMYPEPPPPAPAGVTPNQLQQWWQQEQENVIGQAEQRAKDALIQQQLNEEVEEYGAQHSLSYEEKEFIFTQAYSDVYQSGLTPRKAIQAKGDSLLEAQAKRFAEAQPAQPPATQGGQAAPTTPPGGPPAAATQQYESLDDLEAATRRGEFS